MTADAHMAPATAPTGPLRPADPWFAVEWQADGILRIWEPHCSRLLRANIFLVRGRDRDMLVDAGMGIASLRTFLAPLLHTPVVHVVTHVHVDHVGSTAEFPEEILIHPLEADLLSAPHPDWTISYDDYPEEKKAGLRAAGFDTRGLAIAALPHPGYDPAGWVIPPATPTGTVEDGDVIDLGDRRFEVLHLPGHTPGSIGLWEPERRILIGGDAIYDGLIIDTLPESDPTAYRTTMERILALDPAIVHGGHRESFGPRKLREIAGGYLHAQG